MSNNGSTRREFLGHSFKAGVSAAALGTLLSSCAVTGGSQEGDDASAISIPVADAPWLPSFQKTVQAYQEETGNTVKLQVYPFDGLLSKQLNAANSKSDEFDIFCLNEQWCTQFYDGGFVSPFEEVNSDFSMPSSMIEYGNIARWDADRHYFSDDGTVVGLPAVGIIQLFFYRRDLYDELGLQPPKTWDEVINAAKQAQQKYPDMHGYLVRGQPATYNFEPLLRGFESDFFADPPNDWTVTVNSEQALQAAEMYLELASYGPQAPATMQQPDLIAQMQSGRALQNHMVAAAYPSMDDEAQSSVVGKIGYDVIPRPASGVHATTSGIWLMSIPAYTEDSKKQAAYEFLNWFITKDAQIQYVRAGGMPIREDVYTSDLADQEEYRWMQSMKESTPHIFQGVAYPFAAKMLEVTDLYLNRMLGGELKPKAALDQMASEIQTIVQKSNVAS